MDPTSGIQLAVLVCLVALSGFFSGTETAFTSFNKTRMKTLAQDGDKRAAAVLQVEADYEKFLSTMLVGNNIVNISASTIATLVFTAFLHGNSSLAATVSTIVMTVVVLLFGEISPKFLCKDHADGYTLRLVRVVQVLMRLLTPLTACFSLWRRLLSHFFKSGSALSITEEEIITMVEEAQSEGGIDAHEGDLIRSAIEFNDTEVAAILTPRVDVVAVAEDATLDEVLAQFRSSGFSRLPVYRDSLDSVLGVLHEKDVNRLVYEGGNSFAAHIRKALYIPKSMKISKLLREFQNSKTHLAIVVDEYGGTIGLVTLEDVLEGLVGEIWDEHDDVVENIRPLNSDTYLINCGAPLSELADIYPFADDVLDSHSTVNGWVLDNLGKIPEVGDRFTFERLSVEVTGVDGRRAAEIRLTCAPEEPPVAEEERSSRLRDKMAARKGDD